MTRFELFDMLLVQLDLAGFKRFGASNITFVRDVEPAAGFKFRLLAGIRQNFSTSREFEHMDFSIDACVVKKFWDSGFELASERVELKDGDTIDGSFVSSLLHAVLAKSADVLGKMATVAAAGALTGDL